MPVTVDLEKCVGSRDCLSACAFNAIDVIDGKAVIYENCVDCDACVRACPTHAIISSTAPVAGKGAVLIVDFGDRSGIVGPVERAAKRASSASANALLHAADAGAAADALAADVEKNAYRVIVLPHAGAGPAIAARLAAARGCALLSGCTELSMDDAGGLRATRFYFGGLVRAASRVAPGPAIATVVPRGPAPFPAQPIDSGPAAEKVGDAPSPPEQSASRIVAIASGLAPDTDAAARACARALGARVIDGSSVAGKNFAPELYVAIGVDGSTEHNAAVRGAGTIVALIADANAPIAQIADYLLIGDVREHAQALLAAL